MLVYIRTFLIFLGQETECVEYIDIFKTNVKYWI